MVCREGDADVLSLHALENGILTNHLGLHLGSQALVIMPHDPDMSFLYIIHHNNCSRVASGMGVGLQCTARLPANEVLASFFKPSHFFEHHTMQHHLYLDSVCAYSASYDKVEQY